MPKVTVYIRKEDYDSWQRIERKTEFIHEAISSFGPLDLHDSIVYESQKREIKPSNVAIVKPILNIPIEKVKERAVNGLCKVHGTPLDTRGRCLMKGCKYA